MELITDHLREITVLVALFGGGLAGAAFREIIDCWRRPVLGVVFDEDDPGCALPDIPAERFVMRGQQTYLVMRGQQNYLRIRINNEGHSTAHGVNVCVTKIHFFPVRGDENIFDEEVLELPLAITDRTTFDLPCGGHRYVDLFCAEDFGEGVEYRFAFLNRPGRLYLRPYGPGMYCATIFASSNNSQSKPARVSWRWDGTLSGLHILQCLSL